MSMRTLLLSIVLAAGTFFGLLTSSPMALQRYGRKLFVGMHVEPFDEPTKEGAFNVYFVDTAEHSEYGMDPKSLSQTRVVNEQGGHLHILEFKGTESFGILIVHDGVRFLPAEALMVVTDDRNVVTAIFRNVSIADVRLAGEAAKGEKRAVDRVRRGLAKAQAKFDWFLDAAL